MCQQTFCRDPELVSRKPPFKVCNHPVGPAVNPVKLMELIERDYRMKITYYTAYTAKTKALKDINGEDGLLYYQLTWFTEAIKKDNPGSHVVLDVNGSTLKFERVFILKNFAIHRH
ncbi:hypothetical protein IFM89_012451 [Coptis chinensis]|uniref:Uncharacterized protein n=1 Tax=Coptis chinensis TaxID=261450 RepID=A0A835IDQ7_9MAGN|nr:hypothetical protein IFM89_012451 [Coptis chinensis]